MNNKGITLIALIVTIIVILILVTISIVAIAEGSLIDRTKQVRRDEEITEAKETIRAVTNQVVGTMETSSVNDLALKIESELQKIKGLETTTIAESGDDYIVSMPNYIELNFEEATGKKLPLYIETYVTRTELEGR